MNALLNNSHHFFRGRFLLLLGACLSVYFSYHAIAGQRSVMRLLELERALDTQGEVLQEKQAEKEVWEQKVVKLRPDTLDPDYVEELAVRYLGYRNGATITVLRDDG